MQAKPVEQKGTVGAHAYLATQIECSWHQPCRPWSPFSQPMPLDLQPPKGTRGCSTGLELTQTMPLPWDV